MMIVFTHGDSDLSDKENQMCKDRWVVVSFAQEHDMFAVFTHCIFVCEETIV